MSRLQKFVKFLWFLVWSAIAVTAIISGWAWVHSRSYAEFTRKMFGWIPDHVDQILVGLVILLAITALYRVFYVDRGGSDDKR